MMLNFARAVFSFGWSFLAALAVVCLPAAAQVSVLTEGYDVGRTHANPHESVLTPANVNPLQFGKILTLPVDGHVYTQPLYVQGIDIPGRGVYNVLLVATEHDSVYAFDADSLDGTALLWHASLLDTAHGAAPGAITVPAADLSSGDIVPEVGITATPVLDPDTQTLYVVSKAKEGSDYVQRLHALDVATGAEKLSGPVVITASVPGTGTGNIAGVLTFDSKWENSRAGLLLLNGYVYITFAAHGDNGPFHGWVLAYDAASLQQSGAWCASPNGAAVGIWMSGAGIAADQVTSGGRAFVATGNGTFTATAPPYDSTASYGDSIVRLDLSEGQPAPTDAFTPFDEAQLSASDGDQGSGGVIVLPDQPGAHPHLLVQIGKSGKIFVIDRDNMGGFCAGCTQNSNVLQEVVGAVKGVWATPAFWNNNLFVWASRDSLKRFTLTNGILSSAAIDSSAVTSTYPGATPVVSSNGNSNAIVWAVDTSQYRSGGPAVLRAFDPNDLSHVLYASNTNPGRDSAGPATKFVVPTVANGRVYVGSDRQVAVYGLLANAPQAETPVISPPGGFFDTPQSVTISDNTPNTTIYYTLDGSTPTTASAIYAGPISLSTNTTVTAMAAGPGLLQSAMAQAEFTFTGQVATPTFLPFPGSYSSPQSVTINDTTPGAIIYYTLDGSSPSESSNVYSGPIPVNGTTKIQAIATASGLISSNVATGIYTISNGDNINFGSGFAITSGLSLNGSAIATDDSRLQLTSGSQNQTGSVFYDTPIGVEHFMNDFTFQLSNPDGDGIAFVIQNNDPTALGPGGGGLGYGPDQPDGTAGIPHSIAIKFDLTNNAGEGSNSTGLYINGASPTTPALDLNGTGIDLHSGDTMSVHMTYDGVKLTMTITDPVAGASFTTWFTIDIPAVIGSTTAYVGFTGASSNLTSSQKLLSWTYSSGIPPPQAAPPVMTPGGGAYSAGQSITLTDATPGAAIYFTTDGSIPTTSSSLYQGPIMPASGTFVLKAIAVADGYMESPIASATYSITPPAQWLEGWSERRPVQVVNAGGAALSGFQVRLALDSNFDFSATAPDGSDIRVTDADGITVLPYWIESWSSAQQQAVLWIRVPNIPADGTTLYLYSANPGAAAASNGEATFLFFDDFNSGLINTSKWSASGGAWSVVTGIMQADGRTGGVARGMAGARQMLISSYSGSDYVVEAEGQQVSGRVWGVGVRALDVNNLYSLNLYADLDAADNLYAYAWLNNPGTVDAITLAKSAIGVIDLNKWYLLTAKVHGDSLDFYENGVLRMQATDANFPSGRIALYGEQGSTAYFDNVRIRKWASVEPTVSLGTPEVAQGVASLTISPATVVGGSSLQATVTLTQPASNGGVLISLSSDSVAASLPSSVLVTEGSTGAQFAVSTSPVVATTTVQISASFGTSTRAAQLTVLSQLADLALTPATLTGGDSSQGTVTLNFSAPAGGTQVSLASSDPSVTVAAGVIVNEGSTSATFSITTAEVSAAQVATISATLGGTTIERQLTVNPPAPPGPGWFDPSWSLRAPVEISGTGSDLSGFQVLLNLDAGFDFSAAKNGGEDLRVTDSDGTTPVPFWIETWNPAAHSARVWIRAPFIPAAGTTLYLYYGNPAAAGASNGNATFEFFDDFEGGGIDPGKWTASGGTWTTISDTQEHGTSGSVVRAATTGKQVLLSSYSGSDYVLEVHGKQQNGRVWGVGVRAQDANNLDSVNLYSDLDTTNNLYAYQWINNPGTSAAGILGRTAVGTINAGAWYKLAVKVHGGAIDVFQNDVLRLQVSDPQFAAGRVALYGEENTFANFNNVLVRRWAAVEPVATLGTEDGQTLVSISLNPASVAAGDTSQATVTLSAPAPPGGSLVLLSSSNPAVAAVPASVTVLAGQVNASFEVTTTSGAATSVVQIAATRGTTLSAALNVQGASTPWLDSAWGSRNPVIIVNSGTQLSEFQVQVVLNSQFNFSGAQGNGADVRFTASDGVTLLPFWIESWNANVGSARLWVRVPVIPNGETTVYLYYGNPVALDASNGAATFDFFDDFSGSINPAKWTVTGGAWSVVSDQQPQGSIGNVVRASFPSRQQLNSNFNGTDYVVDVHGKLASGRVWGVGVRASGRNNLYSINLYEDLDAGNNLWAYSWVNNSGSIATRTLGQAVVGALNLNTWYQLTAKVHGSAIDVYRDGVLRLQVTDSLLPSGGIALYGEQNTLVNFDDVRVRKYSPAEPGVSVGPAEGQF